MKTIRTSLKKYNKIILFLVIIFLIGLVSGGIYFSLTQESIVIDLEKELLNLSYSSNNMVFHVVILSLIVISSFFVIGNVVGWFIYFYEAMSIGFMISSYLTYFGIKGVLFAFLYTLIFKLVYVISLTIVLIKLFYFSKNIIGYILLKKDSYLKESAVANFIMVIKMFGIIFISDILLVFTGEYLTNLFSFLIS